MGQYGGKYDVQSGSTLGGGITVLPLGLNVSSSTDPDGMTIVADDNSVKWVQLDAGIWQVNYHVLLELISGTAARPATDVIIRSSEGSAVQQGAKDICELSDADSVLWVQGNISLLLEEQTLVGVCAIVPTADANKVKFNKLTLSFLGVNDGA
jgi:hypothetical protein